MRAMVNTAIGDKPPVWEPCVWSMSTNSWALVHIDGERESKIVHRSRVKPSDSASE